MNWPSEDLAAFAATEDHEVVRSLAKSDIHVLLEVKSHWEGPGDVRGTLVVASRGPGNDTTLATVTHGTGATLVISLKPGETLLLRAEDKTSIRGYHRSPSEHGFRFRIL